MAQLGSCPRRKGRRAQLQFYLIQVSGSPSKPDELCIDVPLGVDLEGFEIMRRMRVDLEVARNRLKV